MAEVKIIRELEGWNGQACLVQKGDKFFAVSSIDAIAIGDYSIDPETLVFPCDEDGENVDFIEVAGGKFVTRDEAIAELAEVDNG